MLRLITFLFFISLFLSANQVLVEPAAAQPEADSLRYVSDVLVINIRDQLEKPFTVVGVVRSGDPVHIIEEQENFYKIETAEKKQGWIGKQYLKKEVPDSVAAQKLSEEIADLKKQLEAKPTDNATTETDKENPAEFCITLQQKLSDAEKQIHQLQEQQKKPTAIHAASSEAVQRQPEDQGTTAQLEETSQRYNQLVIEYEKRGEEIADLQNSIAKQDDTTRFLWFGAGAVVFFLGILAGRSSNRKKSKFMY